MRLTPLLALALMTIGCKKEGSPDQPKPADNAKPGDNAKPADNAKPSEPEKTVAKTEGAPKITPDMLFATEPVWTVEALPRGLWFRQSSGPVEHKCRVAFATTWAENLKVRAAAKEAQDTSTLDPKPIVCGPKAGFTVCTFTDPKGMVQGMGANPHAIAHWVFTGTDAAPIMVAILYGAQDDFDSIAPQLAKVESCPRPSDDPEYK